MTTPQASTPQPPADRARTATTPAVRVACGAEIELHLVTGPGREIPFPARLTYTQADPYAVRLHCRTGPSSSVTWVLSRETLHQGLERPSGLGDVRVRPEPGPGAHTPGPHTLGPRGLGSQGPRPHRSGSVLITLGSGDEAALLRGEAAEIQRFLTLSAAVVPPGTEHRHLDIDALIARLRQAP